jgi:enamine deaminase RidA (YjgF/YER057c/UK114 family)
MGVEAKLFKLGLELPPAPKPAGLYTPLLLSGNMAYVSGHGPLLPDGTYITGRVGNKLDQQAGYDAARRTGLAILATLREGLGSLDRIRRVVKILGMVNCTADFAQHPAVIDGCSQLFSDVFGPEAGISARSAIGVDSLPMGIPVEVEAIFEVVE